MVVRAIEGEEIPQLAYRGQYRVSDMDKGPCGGWLAPDGRYWPCVNTLHQAKVDEIVAELELPVSGDPMTWLEEHGWIHVFDRGGAMAFSGTTQAQMDVMWDLAQRFPEMRERMTFYLRINEEE
jgi:hypothetical protein